MFCIKCGATDVPAAHMYTRNICKDCASIHDLPGKAHPIEDEKLVQDVIERVERREKENG